jgi:two-component system, LuxR family, response regulator FixJ
LHTSYANTAQRLLYRASLSSDSIHEIAINPIEPPMIAIIDDDLSVRQALESLVTSHGYDVQVFASAEDFLAANCLDITVCVLTDIHMPGMSGIELLQRLRQSPQTVPVIVMTAFFDESTRKLAAECGATSILSKPFSGTALIAALEHASHT